MCKIFFLAENKQTFTPRTSNLFLVGVVDVDVPDTTKEGPPILVVKNHFPGNQHCSERCFKILFCMTNEKRMSSVFDLQGCYFLTKFYEIRGVKQKAECFNISSSLIRARAGGYEKFIICSCWTD